MARNISFSAADKFFKVFLHILWGKQIVIKIENSEYGFFFPLKVLRALEMLSRKLSSMHMEEIFIF